MSPTIDSTTLPSGSGYTTFPSSSTPLPSSSTTFSSSSTTFSSSSIAPTSSIPLLDCNEVEHLYHGCLNGGVCKAIEIGTDLRSSFCVCDEDFSGQRCNFLADFDSSLDMTKAGNVAIGVAIGGLLLVILVVGILIALRRWRPKHAKARSTDLTRMTSYDNRGVMAEVEPLHENVTTVVPKAAMFSTARVPTPLVDDVSHFRFPESRPQPPRQRLDGVVEAV